MSDKDIGSPKKSDNSKSPKFILEGYDEVSEEGNIDGRLDKSQAVVHFGGKYAGRKMFLNYWYGKRIGPFSVRTASDMVVVTGWYGDNNICGETTVYDESTGKMRMCGQSQLGMWHGVVEEFDESGQLVFCGKYENGHRCGCESRPASFGCVDDELSPLSGDDRLLPLFSDPHRALAVYRCDHSEFVCGVAVKSLPRLELSGQMTVKSLVIGNGSCGRVRLLRLVDLPELTDIRVGSCSFTQYLPSDDIWILYDDINYVTAKSENRTVVVSGCRKLNVVTIDGGSFADCLVLNISKCDSLADISIGRNVEELGHNFHFANKLVLESE